MNVSHVHFSSAVKQKEKEKESAQEFMSARQHWYGASYSSGMVSEKMKINFCVFFHSNRNDREIPVAFAKTTFPPRRLGRFPGFFNLMIGDVFKMAATNISAFRFPWCDV